MTRFNLQCQLTSEMPMVNYTPSHSWVSLGTNRTTDWKAVFPAHSLLPVIASCSGRVFVGKDLNRNPEFLDCILNFTIDSMMGGEKLRQYPSFIRNFVQWWIPELQRSRAKLKKMMHLLGPVLEVRKGVDHVSDMLSWNVANSPSNLKHNLKYQAHNQLIASAAAIHTTNMQLSHALFDLAAYPEYQAPFERKCRLFFGPSQTECGPRVDWPSSAS